MKYHNIIWANTKNDTTFTLHFFSSLHWEIECLQRSTYTTHQKIKILYIQIQFQPFCEL